VRLHRGAVEVAYLAKGAIERTVALRDPALHRMVNGLLRRRGGGDDLLAFKVGDSWHDVTADDLNVAVKELIGKRYTAKDLRTWNATVLAAVTLAGAAADGIPTAQRARARLVTAAMNEVSEHLGNTPTVARSSYVDPRVITRFEEGRTLLPTLRRRPLSDPLDDEGRAVLDRAVVRLLRD
jgi:DNA topoisomerase IB